MGFLLEKERLKGHSQRIGVKILTERVSKVSEARWLYPRKIQ